MKFRLILGFFHAVQSLGERANHHERHLFFLGGNVSDFAEALFHLVDAGFPSFSQVGRDPFALDLDELLFAVLE
ncbi:MAG TPA: hypothetical protein DCP58_09155 [Verrucomicrobiales bacterium]|nr:hypothetical protein [Verrucomicrobiales bacterium]